MGNGNRVKKRREPKDGEISKLRSIIRRLESDKRKLLSEVRTLEEAFGKNIQFLKGKVKDFSLEELIEAAKKEQSLSEMESPTFEDMEKKWRCYDCDIGVLKIIRFNNREGSKYFRMCSNSKCKKRTKVKDWSESVTGVLPEK